MNSKERLEYINGWKKKKNKNYYFSLSQEYDADVIEILDQKENKTDYIRQLIRSVNKAD